MTSVSVPYSWKRMTFHSDPSDNDRSVGHYKNPIAANKIVNRMSV